MDAIAIIHHSPCSYVLTQLHLQTLQGAPPTSNLQDRQLRQKLLNYQPSIYAIDHLLMGLKNVKNIDYTVNNIDS